jgi:hypothetical protein
LLLKTKDSEGYVCDKVSELVDDKFRVEEVEYRQLCGDCYISGSSLYFRRGRNTLLNLYSGKGNVMLMVQNEDKVHDLGCVWDSSTPSNNRVEQPKLSQTHKIHQLGGVKPRGALVHFHGTSEEVLRRLHFASHASPESVSNHYMG